MFAQPGGALHLYDQFLNRAIDLEVPVATNEIAAIFELAKLRTLVYVNRPKDAQDLAGRLSEQTGRVTLSAEAQRAIKAIAELIDPSYSLIRAIESGVLFHHGQVPDVLRQYIERLFRDDSSTQPRLLVTTSTLLEGVNTPADCLILMTPSRGRRNLSRSAFRNLIGRVARFREVFDARRRDLDLLQPRIHLIRSSYARANWNIQGFLSDVANLANNVEDSVGNPLLERSEDIEGRREALEYLENIEPGSSLLTDARIARTEVGKLCFQNGIRDFDILENESALQMRVETARAAQRLLTEPAEVVETICDLFLDDVELEDTHPLTRVRDSDGAREFYKLFISWRSQNEPYKRLISRFVRYWSQLDEEYVFVGSKWGEETYGPDGVRKLYVRMRAKSRVEMINLAVAKIKEEQDFVDFHIVKYIEIMNSLGLVDRDLYHRIKFGTADSFLICLLRNGFSPELARLVLESYADVIRVDIAASEVTVPRVLSETMSSNGENDVLIYEAETLVNAEFPH
ncbi:helicase-related protein [Salinibacterium sp. PAMC 21357]|uniref:helicase-related protein n=1 Tax=Salinibacterium sp. PAMC 21357 TaxID=1112215 RepID=UPI001ED8F4DA|nr:helicase-related protein [Salinibacterium sp. PAMC 21357]